MYTGDLASHPLAKFPRNSQVKGEFTRMHQSEKKIILHEFYVCRYGRRIEVTPRMLKRSIFGY